MRVRNSLNVKTVSESRSRTLAILLEDEISAGLTLVSLLSLLEVLSTLSCSNESDCGGYGTVANHTHACEPLTLVLGHFMSALKKADTKCSNVRN